MTEYDVEIVPEAEADLDNIFGYIAYELEAGESAYKIVDDLYEAIAKPNVMPKRFRIIDREPWKSRGVRKASGISKRNWRIYMRHAGLADGVNWTLRAIADDEGNISHVRAWQIVHQTRKNIERFAAAFRM